MSSRLFDLTASIYVGGIVAAALFIVVKSCQPSKLDAIPAVGSSSWLGSCFDGPKYLTNAIDLMQEGYKKHGPVPFKVAQPYRWIVILGNRKHMEELRRAPDDVLSFSEAINDQFNLVHIMKPEIHHNPYHVEIIRSQLTRNIGALYSEIRDELIMAFDDVLDLRGNEWKSIPALSSIQKIVSRTSNRVLVGVPLCHNPDWIDLSLQYSVDLAKAAAIVRLFPSLLRPIGARFFTNINRSNQRGMMLLGPIIEERRKCLDEYGDEWANKPNDFLSWLMDEAEGPESTVESLLARVFIFNFAALHTTSNSFTHALFYLAANPQYIKPLREEVEAIIEEGGWSNAALRKMRRVDSFIKECQRIEGISGLSLRRKALKDFTFSDGTFIPKGTLIGVASRSIHHDEAFYEDADKFEPFRFSDLRKKDGEGMKHQFTSTTIEYLPFGHGRHACPGRFFVASELKSMLAHIVVTYDIKLADNAARPPSRHLEVSVAPDPSAEVMFRRRVD